MLIKHDKLEICTFRFNVIQMASTHFRRTIKINFRTNNENYLTFNMFPNNRYIIALYLVA